MFFCGVMAFCTAFPGLAAEQGAEAPDFKEVYDLIREHLGGVTDADLNHAAVKGLVSALSPRVALVTNNASTENSTDDALVVKADVYDGEIGYIRIARVADGLPKAVRDAYTGLSTNKLKGIVLDLRYVRGEDYSAAAATADLFVKKEQPLINWGKGPVRSTEKKDAITLPVAALVNRRTSGAAEALAAAFRQTGVGLILGGKTAGQAMVAKDFPLKDGRLLRIATARIEVGDSTVLSADGVKPDIQVEVSPEDERAYYADAFKVVSRPQMLASSSVTMTNQAGGTNRVRRPRFNEAELVRERRDGASLDLEATNDKGDETDKPVVRDPALARALDLLKGLAVVRHASS